jgi:hypothetical protein
MGSPARVEDDTIPAMMNEELRLVGCTMSLLCHNNTFLALIIQACLLHCRKAKFMMQSRELVGDLRLT